MNYSMIKNIAVFRNSLLLLLLFVNFVAHAAKVDTVLVHSAAMNKDIKVVVVVPQIEGPHPVAYLLHGYGGNEKTWFAIRPDLAQLADRYQMMLIVRVAGIGIVLRSRQSGMKCLLLKS